jgi:hypothetical protein
LEKHAKMFPIIGKCADRYRADAPRPSESGNTPPYGGFISALQSSRSESPPLGAVIKSKQMVVPPSILPIL